MGEGERTRPVQSPSGGAGYAFPIFTAVGVVSLILFLGLWEAAVAFGWLDDLILPRLSHVVRAVIEEREMFLDDMLVSGRRVLLGFLLSTLVGVPVGLFMGVNRWVKAAFAPIISIIRPLPALSWIPLLMIWFGIDEIQKYMVVFMGCFASVVVYTTDATMRVDPVLERAAQNLGASRLAVIRHVTLPAALPNILSGLKVVLAIAWTCVISAEMVGATAGLGFRIWTNKEWGATHLVVAGMLCISVTVLLLDLLFTWLERTLMPWQRRGARG